MSLEVANDYSVDRREYYKIDLTNSTFRYIYKIVPVIDSICFDNETRVSESNYSQYKIIIYLIHKMTSLTYLNFFFIRNLWFFDQVQYYVEYVIQSKILIILIKIDFGRFYIFLKQGIF